MTDKCVPMIMINTAQQLRETIDDAVFVYN